MFSQKHKPAEKTWLINMYRVFLSYNDSATRDEMVAVWRLQTLAAASGLQLQVPTPVQREDWPTITRMIDDADSVIAFLTKRATSPVKREVEYALNRQKLVIPIVEKAASAIPILPILERAGYRTFELDAQHPGKMENDLAEFLSEKVKSRQARNAILALAGTFVGLYLLQQLTES